MTGLDPTQFRQLVIRPTLIYLNPDIPYSLDAEELLLGTALAESGLRVLTQDGGGPARGVFQIEPATAEDCWTNWIHFPAQAAVKLKITNLLGMAWPDTDAQLATNLAYATAISRIVYRRSPVVIPAVGDRRAQGQAWCKGYNRGGSATVTRYVEAWTAAGLP